MSHNHRAAAFSLACLAVLLAGAGRADLGKSRDEGTILSPFPVRRGPCLQPTGGND
jgi:hypothetical protein